MQIAILTGVALLLFLCWNDFKDKIVRPKSAVRYYAALAFFLAVNVCVYFLILRVVLEVPAAALLSEPAEPLSGTKILQPILVALLYFGAGAATFKFGKGEFNFYRKIIRSFQSMFRPRWERSDIEEQIDRARPRYKTLKERIERVHEKLRPEKWCGLQGAVASMQQDMEMTDDQICHLKAMRERLTKEQLSAEDINSIKKEISERIEKLHACSEKKMIKHLAQLILNSRNEADIETIARGLIVEPPPRRAGEFDAAYRSLVLSFLIGMSFGPIFAISRNLDPVMYGWYGALALSASGVVMSLIKKLECKQEAAVHAVSIGALAGALGSLTWSCLTDGSPPAEMWKTAIADSIIGIQCGASVSLALYLPRNHFQKTRHAVLLQFISTALLGGAAFVLMAMLNSAVSPRKISFVTTGIGGMVISVAMAFSLDIFGEKTLQKRAHHQTGRLMS